MRLSDEIAVSGAGIADLAWRARWRCDRFFIHCDDDEKCEERTAC